MNRTNFEHLAVAVALQCVVGALTGDWLAGACLASGEFVGREHAQREYEIGNPSNLVGYEALDFWRWSRDALLDLLLPVATVAIVVFLMARR